MRSREAHSTDGVFVGRRGFLLLGGFAALVGLVAAGVGRLLTGGGAEVASKPKKLDLPRTPAKPAGGAEGRREARDAAASPKGGLDRRARDA